MGEKAGKEGGGALFQPLQDELHGESADDLCSTCVPCNQNEEPADGTDAYAARRTADLLGSECRCTIVSAGLETL